MSAAPVLTELDHLYQEMKSMRATIQQASSRAPFRDIIVKLHIRKPERDSWCYLGRAIVTQEVVGQSSRLGTYHGWITLRQSFSHRAMLVVISASSKKVLATFHEVCRLLFASVV